MHAIKDEHVLDTGFRQRPAWFVVLFALVAVQAATTLTLFSPSRSWRPVVDDRPITSGRHALHYYHGILGAQSWKSGNFGAAYDPAFQAGYPKTPIFDSGSRPAELFLLMCGDRPAAYKLGLAACCLVVPLVFAGGARLLQLGPGTACLTAGLAQVAWWGSSVQELLQQGHLDWLLGGQIVFLHAALLVRFHQSAGVRVWLGLAATSVFGWFCHPILWLGFVILFVPFYLSVALRHGGVWNLALWAAWCGGFLANVGWLADWVRFCWISLPLPNAASDSLARIADWWASGVWGQPHDRLFAVLLFAGGAAGVGVLLRRGQTAAALTLGATALVLPILSAGGNYWMPLESIGVGKLLVLGVGFAAAPCARAITALFEGVHRIVRHPVGTAAVGLCLVAGFVVPLRSQMQMLAEQSARTRPLALGLTEEQEQLVQTLRVNTSTDGRVLFEDRARADNSWTTLLPMRTKRCFLGGLGPDPGVEHVFATLSSNALAGRPIEEWSNADLERFCRRYNVGHIVCWSPAVLTRFHNWPGCEPLLPVREHGDGWLFKVKLQHSYVLKGKAKVSQLDAERIALDDVEPDDGVVILSLHFQEGWRVSPSHIQIEPEPDPYDPIPFMRLRLKGPVMRLTLTWEGEW